jgi:serine/threonine protein kinase
MSQADARQMIKQVASAIAYMHRFGLCHGDLKPENIMLKYPDDISDLRLIDFGFSQELEEGQFLKDPIGTATFCAPEIIMQKFDMRIDNWCMGIVLYNCLTGNLPFKGSTKQEIMLRTLTHEIDIYIPEFACLHFGARELVLKLLTKDPDQRITAEFILKHPWVIGYIEDEFRYKFLEDVLHKSQRLPLFCKLSQLIVELSLSADDQFELFHGMHDKHLRSSFSDLLEFTMIKLEGGSDIVRHELPDIHDSVLALSSGKHKQKYIRKCEEFIDSEHRHGAHFSKKEQLVFDRIIRLLESEKLKRCASNEAPFGFFLPDVEKHINDQYSIIYEMISEDSTRTIEVSSKKLCLDLNTDPNFLLFVSLLVRKLCRTYSGLSVQHSH